MPRRARQLRSQPRTQPGDRPARPALRRRPGGFTLVEALVAATVLGVVVLAVLSSVSTAHTMSFEGQKRVLAAMAADDLLLELSTLEYADLAARDGFEQPVGEMATLDGEAYPETFWSIGRSVSVEAQSVSEPALGVTVTGVLVTVTASDERGPLVSLAAFIPEPAP
ncbi:MAG TPA: hypothetical protein DEB06_05945 [Phycisphaerales bacterium]|nr:hypothetical protein [Phycisphaerales bacterium]